MTLAAPGTIRPAAESLDLERCFGTRPAGFTVTSRSWTLKDVRVGDFVIVDRERQPQLGDAVAIAIDGGVEVSACVTDWTKGRDPIVLGVVTGLVRLYGRES